MEDSGYIPRKITPHIIEASKFFPVIVITGPRQTGKTTLCNHIFEDFNYYNLENIALRNAIAQDPEGFLNDCGDKVILDECQNYPDLFSYIQVKVDENRNRRFILTGSNNFSLLEMTTQSMAGRAAVFTLLPFALNELPSELVSRPTDNMLLKGFYPAPLFQEMPAHLFYPNYYSTYIERDVRQLKQITDLGAFQKLIQLVAGRVGTELNASSLANETGISSPTVKSWITVLEASYIVYTLPPYYVNISKRLTKSPKLYFYDTGLLCFILGITEIEQLKVHPLRGAIFENLIVSQMIKAQLNCARRRNLFFYRENSGREVDIVRPDAQFIDAFEVKSSSTFNTEFVKNLKYLKDKLPSEVRKKSVIYDGQTIPPDIFNFRDYFASGSDSEC